MYRIFYFYKIVQQIQPESKPRYQKKMEKSGLHMWRIYGS